MSKVEIRMKNKVITKIHLDASGSMAMTPIKVTSDSISKGINAQPVNPLSVQEEVTPKLASTKIDEMSTGAPAERVAPETILEKDVQPAPKDLEQAPSQASLAEKAIDQMSIQDSAPSKLVTQI